MEKSFNLRLVQRLQSYDADVHVYDWEAFLSELLCQRREIFTAHAH